MLVLFDHVTPGGVARSLEGHKVVKAKERGWDTLTNGDLLSVGESAGFDVLLTADKNMRYQQNLAGRKIALVVLSTPQWPVVRLNLEKIAAAVNVATPGSYTEVELLDSRV
jgi:hypothetical protein